MTFFSKFDWRCVYSIKKTEMRNSSFCTASLHSLTALPVKRLVNKKLFLLQVENSKPSDAKICPLGSELGLLLFHLIMHVQGQKEQGEKSGCEKQTEKFKIFRSIPIAVLRGNLIHSFNYQLAKDQQRNLHLFCKFSQNDSNYFYFRKETKEFNKSNDMLKWYLGNILPEKTLLSCNTFGI